MNQRQFWSEAHAAFAKIQTTHHLVDSLQRQACLLPQRLREKKDIRSQVEHR
jgi:hypothetical protein